MAITTFRISKLPSRVDCLKNAVAATLNTSYPLAEENQISFDNQSGFKGEFLDEMEIEVSEDGILWSPSAIVKIKELVGVNTPESVNETVTGAKNTDYALYGLSKFPINNSTDRIKIASILGYGTFKRNGIPLTVGTVVYMHELPDILGSTDNGAGLPHMSLLYYCGNHLGFNTATTYKIEINVASLAEIATVSVNGTNPVTEDVLISKGLSGKSALVSVNVTGTMFANGAGSEVILFYSGLTLVITANGTQNISVLLDNEGKSNIGVQHNYTNLGTPSTSNVQLTIQDVDGNAGNVSGTNSYTSTINYT